MVATLVIEQDNDGGNARVVDVRLQSLDGHGLNGADLRILEGLGLQLQEQQVPQAEPVTVDPPAPAPDRPVLAAKPATKTPPVTKPVAKKKRTGTGGGKGSRNRAAAADRPRPYRPCPPLKELDEAVRDHGGSPTALAEHYDVPRHTVQGWLRRHRGAGHVFPDAQPTPTEVVR